MTTSNPLTELIPAKARKYVYRVAAAALFVYALIVATAGDWTAFGVSLVTALVSGLAGSNTGVNEYVEAVKTAEDEPAEDDGHYRDGH